MQQERQVPSLKQTIFLAKLEVTEHNLSELLKPVVLLVKLQSEKCSFLDLLILMPSTSEVIGEHLTCPSLTFVFHLFF